MFSGTYPPYDDGMKMDIFIKNASGQVLESWVWNHMMKNVFPDFTNSVATQYWYKQFKDFYNLVPFDGAWTDMNEISNMRNNGSIYGCPKNSTYENPPYRPGNVDMHFHAICLTAKQQIGIQYNVHNLYSIYQSKVTDL